MWKQVVHASTGVVFETEVGIAARFLAEKMDETKRNEVMEHLSTCHQHWGGEQCANTRCVNQWFKAGAVICSCGDAPMTSQFLVDESDVCVLPSGPVHHGTTVGEALWQGGTEPVLAGVDITTVAHSWGDTPGLTPDVDQTCTNHGDGDTNNPTVTRTWPALQMLDCTDGGASSRLGEEHVGEPEAPSGAAEDMLSAQHHAWLLHVQSKKTVVLAKIAGAVDNVHGWAKATVKGRVRDTDKWKIAWEHQSACDTLKSASEIKKINGDLTSWEKETVKQWKQIRKKIQRHQQFAPPTSNNGPVLVSVPKMLDQPLYSSAVMTVGFFHEEILTPAVMAWKCCHFFGEGKRVVSWAPLSMEVHVPKWGQNDWAIVHCTKAGRKTVSKVLNQKLQRGCRFRTAREASFFLKSATIIRLGHGQSKTFEVLVTDSQNGTSRRQTITVTYEDAKRYLKDFRDARIPYITDIVDNKTNHCLNVWVSGETVLYLPAPLTNLDARQSMMVAQSYGKRWRAQDEDISSEDPDTYVPQNGHSQTRPVALRQWEENQAIKGN